MDTAKKGTEGWLALVLDALMVAVVAFVVLQAKELIDAGVPDVSGVLVDALLIGGGCLLVEVVLKLVRNR